MTGYPWRDLLERYGPWQTCYDRFSRWRTDETWDRLLAHVRTKSDAVGEMEWKVSADATVVRAHQHAAGARQEPGGRKGVTGTPLVTRRQGLALAGPGQSEGAIDMQILVLQGPNMNRLGLREPEIYGTRTLADVQGEMDKRADRLGCHLAHFQSNSEGALIDWLQQYQDGADAIVCNPAGLTPYGLSLRDALAETKKDLAIVHLSNVHAREQWRRHDVFAELADVYLAGLGWRVYLAALDALYQRHAERTADAGKKS